MKRFEYFIVIQGDTDSLAFKVETYLNNGWTLQGGIAISPEGIYAQALTREHALAPVPKKLKPLELSQEECQKIEAAGRDKIDVNAAELAKELGVSTFMIISDLMEMNIFGNASQLVPKEAAKKLREKHGKVKP